MGLEIKPTCQRCVELEEKLREAKLYRPWLGAFLALIVFAACEGMTGCVGSPYIQLNLDYDYIDHNGDVTFGEGVGTRVEAGWDFGPAECGIYHFSHPMSHRNEVAVNGAGCGVRKTWGK